MKKLTAIILFMILTLSMILQTGGTQAQAAGRCITVRDFAKAMSDELGLTAAEGSGENGYIDCLKNIGVIKDGDFTSYSKALTRGDLLVLMNRADEYLNHSTVAADLVEKVIKKRISDIGQVSDSKAEDVAKGFIKGFMKGYRKRVYSSNRELRVRNKILKKDALKILKMLKTKSLRAKISPDGQLIRTTKLPDNAYMFPYILDSFPNSYYEARLLYEGVTTYDNGRETTIKSPEDYTYPKNVAKAYDGFIKDYKDTMKKYCDIWMDKVYTRVWNTFNVNYKTIDNDWVVTMAKTDSDIYEDSNSLYQCLNDYITSMKNNKTIVECDKVAMDSSSMYYFNGFYFIRCYVHYRIVSTNTKTSYTSDEFFANYWGPYNSILFSRSSDINLSNYKLNQWTNGIFDIGIVTGVYGNDGSMYGVCDCDWSPSMFKAIERRNQ